MIFGGLQATSILLIPNNPTNPSIMSKRIIGKYNDGSPARCYFRKHKHHRIRRNGFRAIRWKMYLAHQIKTEL